MTAMNELLGTILSQVSMGQFLEGGMLACFGASWPVSILKTWRAKRVEGKSRGFLVLVLMGYLSGIVAKFARADAAAGLSVEPVTWLYFLNFTLIAADLALVTYYGRRNAATLQ